MTSAAQMFVQKREKYAAIKAMIRPRRKDHADHVSTLVPKDTQHLIRRAGKVVA